MAVLNDHEQDPSLSYPRYDSAKGLTENGLSQLMKLHIILVLLIKRYKGLSITLMRRCRYERSKANCSSKITLSSLTEMAFQKSSIT